MSSEYFVELDDSDDEPLNFDPFVVSTNNNIFIKINNIFFTINM